MEGLGTAEELVALAKLSTLPHRMFPRLARLSEAEAMPFNVSVLRSARRHRLIQLQQMKSGDTTAESMTTAIVGAIYVEG